MGENWSFSLGIIILEYLAYSLIWGSGAAFTYDNSDRWLYMIPFRNLALVIITGQSLYEHCRMIRPPLPHSIEITHVFEIKELYNDFYSFLLESKNLELIEACKLCKECWKASYMKNYEFFVNKFEEFHTIVNQSLTLEYFCEKKRESLEEILSDALKNYLESDQFLELKNNILSLLNNFYKWLNDIIKNF